MPRKIKSWKELVGLENENYKLEIELIGDADGCGWIVPKKENNANRRIYLSTHTFYPSHYMAMTEILQKCGFDVELIKD